jgi:hypothetical protein
MARYKSKPVEIEAVRWTGENVEEVADFAARIKVLSSQTALLWVAKSGAWCSLPTGTYVMKEPDGTGFYPCDPAVFESRWEQVR